MKEKESEWFITWHNETYVGTYAFLCRLTEGYLGPVFERVKLD